MDNEEQKGRTFEHLKKYQWPKGVSGNPNGRPPGSISPRDKIRQMFEANPDDFEGFLEAYINDPKNRRHVVELLDGKPHQHIDHTTGGKELPQPIINVFPHLSDTEGYGNAEENTGSAGGNLGE